MVNVSDLEKILGSKGRIRILAVFFENEDSLLSIREASKLADIAYSKAHKYIKELEEAGILRKYHRYYMLNKNSKYYEKLQGLFVSEKSQKHVYTTEAKELVELLQKYGCCDIYVHHNADPDAIGSAIALATALKKMGIRCDVIAPASLSAQSKALLKKYPYPIKPKSEMTCDLVIIVDTASEEQLAGVNLDGKTIIVIDHHQEGNLKKKAYLTMIDPEARASAVLVYELLKAMNVKIDTQIAFFIAAGIIADTGFLRNARNREIKVMAELAEYVNIQQAMASIHLERDRSERIAILKSMRRAEVYIVDNFLVAISEIGSFEAACALAIMRAGADVAIVANVGKSEIRISCRTSVDACKKLNLKDVFKKLEKVLDGQSGGHETALSFNGKSPENWDEAKDIILKELETNSRKKIKRIA